LNAHIIDNIALANLRPDKPVIPLSLLTYELKLSLERDAKAGTINLDKITEDSLKTYVKKMIDHLEKVVLIKNRIDLYHKEGVGLTIALNENHFDEEHNIDDENPKALMSFPNKDCEGLYEDAYRVDGASKTSKTKSLEDQLRTQDL